jgi:hypothetical protein
MLSDHATLSLRCSLVTSPRDLIHPPRDDLLLQRGGAVLCHGIQAGNERKIARDVKDNNAYNNV